ncbi:MAG TPA: hypothetical protein VK034_00880, partial [Enhygromyxa sp.]|nr:hypothetical protein [Enhygromyxa sp.]
MSDAVVYFLPWMRRGLVRQLASQADADGVPTASLATVTASVVLGSETATRELEIAGPGVVIGVRRSQIVRRFPTPNTRDFERNDFPHVELASPDLPWMFTPASARADRLMPWLVLVVVEERDGVSHAAGDPLPVLTVDSARRELPDLRQASAWAHVQAAVDPGRNVGEAFATTPE